MNMKIFFLLSILCLILGTARSQDTVLICHQEEVSLFALDNINTKSIEFSPTYYGNGIVFVEAREQNRFLDPKTGKAYFDLMYTDIGPDGSTGKVVSFSPNIRTQFHEGPATFNQDGTEIFFTKSNLSGGTGINDTKGQVQLKIYHGTQGETDWESIGELPFNNDEYTVAHPALSPDGNYLVFISNMPGGSGGMDLYISNHSNGDWSTPVNLGTMINTKGNEAFPFWHASGTLIFSSDGHDGLGGLDLFATGWNGHDGFKGLQHLSAPFNSGRDDLGLIVAADGMSGYMASDRKPTKGRDDLYRWNSSQSIFCAPAVEVKEAREITVVSEGSAPIDKAYVWFIPMNQEGPEQYKEHFTTELVPKPDKPGAFYLQWGVIDTLSTATAHAITNHDGRAAFATNWKSTYILVVQHDGYVPFVEVFPEDLLPSEVVLKKIIEKSEHCFTTRFIVYNESGSLKLNGASIELTGSCLKAAVKQYTNEEGALQYCLPDNCSTKALISQEGYASHAFTFTPSEEGELWSVYLKSSETLTAPPSPIASGTVIVLDNIYYDFNKSEIRKSDAGELVALAKILKEFPDLKIELTSHTDTRGTAEYNMELAERRSASSKSYLILLGIYGKRIETKAAGESEPRNKCIDGVPCTEAEHQYNRRTEVRIINPAQGMEVKYKSQG
jgi:outer membrane protein OmpA-like peptidoglycan-associated protein